MIVDADRPTVEVVVPVYNEERDLERCVRRLHAYLCSSFPFDYQVTIADNASTDGTWPLAQRLAGELEHVRAVRLDQKGRGRALRTVWGASPAAVLAYMDVDLSTGLEALLPLAERSGLRIHEVPVDWVDDPDSRVDLLTTAVADLRGIARLSRDLVSFAFVGVASTLAYLVLYLALRAPLGAQGANGAALLATAVANTAANRRWTFSVRGAVGALRHQLQGLAVFAFALALTAGALGAMHAAAPRASRALEVTVLVMANLVAAFVRFLLLRDWVFHPSRPSGPTTTATTAIEPTRSTR